MTSFKTFAVALAAGGAAVTAGAASAQTPYTATPYAQTPYAQQTPYDQSPYGQTSQPQDAFTAILGALFGDRLGVSTSLESEWSRGRRPLNTQRAQFRSRLDAEVRAGSISSNRAARLNGRYDELVQLEARYAADGRITSQEQADLAARYRTLTERVEDATDGSGGGGGYGQYRSIADGRSDFEARVQAAVNARTLDRNEAWRLRQDYQALVQLEAGYQRDGLNSNERADLQNRLTDLERRAGFSSGGGWNDGGGWNNGGNDGGYGYDDRARLNAIEAGVTRAERSNWINRSEAADIRVELGDLIRLEAAYSRSRPSQEDTAYLTRRIGELEARARISSR